MGLPQTIGITRQMVLNELIKAGINRDIADDLSYRYYHNELTFKDLELIKMELKSDIKDLDNKIDENKIKLESTLKLHNWMFGTIITLCTGIFLTLIGIIYSFLSK
ncbi:Bdr family repetitive protein [Borrelia coriaceae]|uniref:BDR-repeat family protein n=1 Tax=Borrelia coriaceae ATCC 43381 TaxID=1408429 RepID=W5SXS9_9SPIR|nr:Bdr family repetitive protein [Borrelia coriaceae]AHH11720.1 BDR-repeat family protein [Borrelia coriaceae ATCC 43381]